MGDQIMPYAYGTWVWAKLVLNIWWPGKVVDPDTIPKDLHDYINRKKNPVAIVYFEKDTNYEIVYNSDKICPYSNDKKMEFVEKGYAKYLKQKNGSKVTRNFNMNNFLDDVISAEKQIGGDVNIFDQFVEKYNIVTPTINIKELFTTAKKTKKKSASRKSLPTFRTPTKKEKPKLKKTIKPIVPSTSFSPSTSTSSLLSTSTSRSVEKGYFYCHLSNDCPFATKMYDHLKRHMASHNHEETPAKTNGKKSGSSKRSTSQSVNKRKYVKSRRSCPKKIKLQQEILKDWDDEVEDEDRDAEFSRLAEDVTQTKSKVRENTSDTIFDFGEKSDKSDNDENDHLDSDNDESVLVHSQINSERDFSSAGNELGEGPSTPELTELIGCKTTQENSNYLVEEAKDDSENLNESKKGQTDEFVNEIDNQIKNTTLLLENTGSTLQQISNLEESLNGVANSVNVTEVDKDIGVADVSSLKDISPNKSVNHEIDDFENSSSQSKSNIIPNDVASDNSEVQPLIDTNKESMTDMSVDKNTPCSTVGGSLTEKDDEIDYTENGRYECLLSHLPVANWAKEEPWPSSPQELKEAMLFSRIDRQLKFMALDNIKPLSSPEDPFEPIFVSEIDPDNDDDPPPSVVKTFTVRVPLKEPEHTTEELLAMPEVQKLQELMKSKPGSVKVHAVDGQIVCFEP